jgi:hypothetical protein
MGLGCQRIIDQILYLMERTEGYGRTMYIDGMMKPKIMAKGIASTLETMSDVGLGLKKVGEVKTVMAR